MVAERGDGVHVVDVAGRRHLDGLSSLYCCQIGYSFGAEMAEVAGAQLRRLPFHTNWATAHPGAIDLAERLCELAPAGISRAFFTNGGAESVEAAWKMVRLFHLANGEPNRTKAIVRRAAYHGVTLGALSFTGVDRSATPSARQRSPPVTSPTPIPSAPSCRASC